MKTARMLDLGFMAPIMMVGAILASTPACSSGNMGSDPGVTAGTVGTTSKFNGRQSRNRWLWHQHVAVTKPLSLALRTQST